MTVFILLAVGQDERPPLAPQPTRSSVVDKKTEWEIRTGLKLTPEEHTIIMECIKNSQPLTENNKLFLAVWDIIIHDCPYEIHGPQLTVAPQKDLDGFWAAVILQNPDLACMMGIPIVPMLHCLQYLWRPGYMPKFLKGACNALIKKIDSYDLEKTMPHVDNNDTFLISNTITYRQIFENIYRDIMCDQKIAPLDLLKERRQNSKKPAYVDCITMITDDEMRGMIKAYIKASFETVNGPAKYTILQLFGYEANLYDEQQSIILTPPFPSAKGAVNLQYRNRQYWRLYFLPSRETTHYSDGELDAFERPNSTTSTDIFSVSSPSDDER